MPRPARVALAVALVVLAVAGGVWWYNRPEPVRHTTPVGAPRAGTCYRVDAAAARAALPWTGHDVPCTGPHTVELFAVGQVDDELIRAARDAEGDRAERATLAMYTQARRACLAGADRFLGGSWHGGRLTVLANWIKPAKDGFYGCAVAATLDPGAGTFATSPATLRGAMAGGAAAPMAIACVRQDGTVLRYVGCATRHDGEYVGSYTLTPPDAPFHDASVRAAAESGCTRVALDYLGLRPDAVRRDLRPGYVGPVTAEAWVGSDQTFACYAMAAVPVRGSLRGLGNAPLPR